VIVKNAGEQSDMRRFYAGISLQLIIAHSFFFFEQTPCAQKLMYKENSNGNEPCKKKL
jgi:hypothetical protein